MVGVAYHAHLRELPENERPRERLALYGEKALSSVELIAIALRTGTQAQDVMALSMRLLQEFRGLAGLGQASFQQLCDVPGIGPAKAAQLKAALELGRRAMASGDDTRPVISSPEIAADLLCPSMCGEMQEQLRVMLLDAKHRVQRTVTVYQGSVNSSPVRIAEVFREAVKDNAPAIILAHNHPSGDPAPSPEDIRVTQEVRRAGKLLDVALLDHLIIGRPSAGEAHRYISLKDKGLGFD